MKVKYLYFILLLVLLLIFHYCKTSPTQSEITTRADIGFISIINGKHSIILMDIDGSNQVNVTKDSDLDILNFHFSPDGSKIYFASAFGESGISLYSYDIENKTRVKLTDNAGSDQQPNLSLQGDKIAFISTRNTHPNTGLCVLDLSSNSISKLICPDEIRFIYEPKFSPDGQKIVFHAVLNDETQHIFLVNTDGTGSKKLTSYSDLNQNPQFSPDGTKIVFKAQDINQRSDIYSMDISGNNLTNLTYDSLSHVSGLYYISKESPKILYVDHKYHSESDSSEYQIKTVNLDGTSSSVIATFSKRVYVGEYSLDGSKIVFQYWYDGNGGDIAIMGSNGENITILTKTSNHCHHPKFNPNI